MHVPTFYNKDPPVLSIQCHNKTFDVDEAKNRRTDTAIDEKCVVKKTILPILKIEKHQPF